MLRSLCLTLAGGIVLAAIVSLQADDAKTASPSYRLRYKFRANQRVNYQVTSTTVIKIAKGSARAEVRNESTTGKHYEVTAVDDKGNALLEPVIDRVKMSAESVGGQKKTYDSTLKNEPLPQFAGVAKTIGKTLVRLKVAPNGKLLRALPLIEKNVQKKVVQNAGPARAANDPSKNFLVVFPEKPIRVGESWTDEDLKVNLLVQSSPRLWQPFVILRSYRLTSVTNGLATIELSTASRKPVNQPHLEAQLVQRLLSGTIVFDLNRGVIVSRKLSGDNKVIGFSGPQSLLHVRTVRSERLVEKRGKIARKASDHARE